jgi:4-alpha-glucanotransferase
MERSAGILLHPTSLSTAHGIGDLGPVAHDYVSWLGEAGVGWWQVLPLHPPGPGFSPYSSLSTFAGSPWLISPERLAEDGLLDRADLEGAPSFPSDRVDYPAAVAWKRHLLETAWRRFRDDPGDRGGELGAFRERHGAWLEDYVLFVALKEAYGDVAFTDWPSELVRREPEALEMARARLADACSFHEFCQLVFFDQWRALRQTAERHGVRIFGDVPIFVAGDSADVWSRPDLFLLDDDRRPTVVAGVPPDYFSATGQLWGNPLYAWSVHASDDYAWWIRRMRHELELTDAVRLDHFRGFAAYWEVPAGDDTAINGRWVPGPGRRLFDALAGALGGLPLVAEDLGEITPDVIELRKDLGLPGMAILHFGFDPEPRSTFIPYAHEPDLVVYTGTHDNNTTVGWYEQDASEDQRDLFRRYAASDAREPHWDLIRLALGSVGELAVVPHQDLLGLGSEARMNRPGVGEGNWDFRLPQHGLAPDVADRFRDLLWTYGRLATPPPADESPSLEGDDG